MIGGRFMATKIEKEEPLSKRVSNLTGLFHSRVSEIAKPSETTKPIKTDQPREETTPEQKPPEEPNKEIES